MTGAALLALVIVSGPVQPLLGSAWTVDRIEPPYAVLISPDGHPVDVPTDALPPGAREGDVFAASSRLYQQPAGRFHPARRRARLTALARRMAPILSLNINAPITPRNTT